ncbi:hypothetical protein [Zhihengliuella sp. ISTPL4]|uniref:hypothetical protein n=1 Tax=Zhihengliuella sp. ISTPL4 TaxID=2058657 RepID=UPI000C7A74A5|nr:hypothetical protein [Zhihengliuella sp. ISTPL4]
MVEGAKRSAETSSTSRRSRIAGVVSFVIGAVAMIVAVPSLFAAGADVALLVGGLLALVVAGVSFLFGVFAVRFLRRPATRPTAMTPLLWLIAAAFFLGVLGSMAAFVYSQVIQSVNGAAVALLLVVLGGAAVVTGAALGGAVVRERRAAAAGR